MNTLELCDMQGLREYSTRRSNLNLLLTHSRNLKTIPN